MTRPVIAFCYHLEHITLKLVRETRTRIVVLPFLVNRTHFSLTQSPGSDAAGF
ncbi:MAG: hypothetical protein NTX17_03745 [Candidatus Eisenbacteria bacterium]|nr:hypothetical protein [Candidatus Eisenbacteria bacterium]